MISHHELAKLFLISRVPEEVCLGDPDVDALIRKCMVDLMEMPNGKSPLRITDCGIAVLNALEGTERIHHQRSH